MKTNITRCGNIGKVSFLPCSMACPVFPRLLACLSVCAPPACCTWGGSGGPACTEWRRPSWRRRGGKRGGAAPLKSNARRARRREREREEEKLCIKFSCCSFSSGWPRSGGTEECVPDKLSNPRPGRGTPRSDGDRPTPESACNPRGPLRRRGTGKQSFSAALSMQSSVGVSE